MTGMPAEQRFRFGERRQMICGDQALHRDRAKIGYFEIIAPLQLLHRLRIETATEARRRVDKPEKYYFAHGAEHARLARRKQRIA